jgi:RNA polymerase sigma-70 factor, ECF subfamily
MEPAEGLGGRLTSKTAGGVRVNEEVLSFPPRERAARTGPTLSQVFHSSYRRLVVQLYGVVGDVGEAEDLVQEAFVRATAAGRRFLGADNHEAWLRTTAIRLHRNRWRKLRNFARIRHRLEQPTDLQGLDEHVAVVAALRSLPEPQRQVIALYYLADLSVAEVAETLGCPVGTVKSRLQRAREALAVALAPEERADV